MPDYPPLSTQVIGQAESALGALLDPLLAGTGITFGQWLVLTVTAASGAGIDRGQLVARISDARKVDGSTVGAALTEATAAGLVTADGPVALTDDGRAAYHRSAGRLSRSPPGCSTSRPRTSRPQAGSSASSPRAPTPCSPGRPPPREQPDGRS